MYITKILWYNKDNEIIIKFQTAFRGKMMSDNNLNIYIGREQSWLKFNERVLLQAAAPEVPLLERMRFCAIFTSNLDEFFMVRAGSLHDRSLLPNLPPDNKTLMSAAKQLSALYSEARRLYVLRDRIFEKLILDLEASNVRLLCWEELDKEEKRAAKQLFKQEIAPLAQPYIIDEKHPFPHLANKIPHVILSLRKGNGKHIRGIVPMPDRAPRILCFRREAAGEKSMLRVITAEEILLHEAHELFSKYSAKSRMLFRITRNADIEIADNFSDDPDFAMDYPAYLKILLENREKLGAVRLEYLCKPKMNYVNTLTFLLTKLRLTLVQSYRSQTPIDYTFASAFIKEAAPLLPEGCFHPKSQITLALGSDVMSKIDRGDILLSYPYHSMHTYLDFLRQAAFDPHTESIKITLYRMASHSQIISLLRSAAEKGIKVTTVVELKARFDEENNLHWAKLLEDAGCRVIYGMTGLKVHSKVTLVTMRQCNELRRYAHIGTGNYNEQTAKLYTDLSIMTADPSILSDVEKLFCSLETGELYHDYKELLVSPTTLKSRILSEIFHETNATLCGRNGYICMKMNSLTDKDIIDALVDASRAGVRIDLIIRGICCLKSGIPNETENIRVVSIVGRYLEHSRIFIFGNDEGCLPRVYIGSADMMTRNTSRRIEVLTPVKSPDIIESLVRLTRLQLRDNVKASEMSADGLYRKREPSGKPFDSQMELFHLYHEFTETVREVRR